MKVRTTRVGGFLRLKMLAALRGWRPRTLRYAEEQAWIDRWLDLVERALAVDANVAREVVETARLVKGYGETYKRGHANWNRIVGRSDRAVPRRASCRGAVRRRGVAEHGSRRSPIRKAHAFGAVIDSVASCRPSGGSRPSEGSMSKAKIVPEPEDEYLLRPDPADPRLTVKVTGVDESGASRSKPASSSNGRSRSS